MAFQPPSTVGQKRPPLNSSHASSSQLNLRPDVESLQLSMSEMSVNTKVKSSTKSNTSLADNSNRQIHELTANFMQANRRGSEESRASVTSSFSRFLFPLGHQPARPSVDDSTANASSWIEVSGVVADGNNAKKTDDFAIDVTLKFQNQQTTWTVFRTNKDVTTFHRNFAGTGVNRAAMPVPPLKVASKHKKSRPASSSMKNVLTSFATSMIGRSKQQTGKKCDNMQEYINECLSFWQRQWRSARADNDGVSKNFQHFFCKTSVYGLDKASELAPESFRAALDALILKDRYKTVKDEPIKFASTPHHDDMPMDALSQDQTAVSEMELHSQSFLRSIEQDRTRYAGVEPLRHHCFRLAWNKYCSRYSINDMRDQDPDTACDDDEDPPIEFYTFIPGDLHDGRQPRFVSGFVSEPARRVEAKLASLHLIDVFSCPPSPISYKYYADVWKDVFTNTVLYLAAILLYNRQAEDYFARQLQNASLQPRAASSGRARSGNTIPLKGSSSSNKGVRASSEI